MASAHDGEDYDAHLRRTAGYGPDLANGFTNHAPMVVDALWSLGRADAVTPWLDRYLPGALVAGAAGQPIPPDVREAALGRSSRFADWQATFVHLIESRGWQSVLADWLPRLAPGFAGAAAHGIIRTAHAARALAERDVQPRRAELASALALWASAWQSLPGRTPRSDAARPARETWRAVPRVPGELRRNDGAITDALGVLDGRTDFLDAVTGVRASGTPTAMADALAETFADLFMHQARTALHAIVYTHAITGVVAVERLHRWTDRAGADALVDAGWRFGAALYACYGEADVVPTVRPAEALDALVDAAVRHGDEHVIKLTEACLELYARTEQAVFLAVPRRAMTLIPA